MLCQPGSVMLLKSFSEIKEDQHYRKVSITLLLKIDKSTLLIPESGMMQSTVLKEGRNGDTKVLIIPDDDPAASNNS